MYKLLSPNEMHRPSRNYIRAPITEIITKSSARWRSRLAAAHFRSNFRADDDDEDFRDFTTPTCRASRLDGCFLDYRNHVPYSRTYNADV